MSKHPKKTTNELYIDTLCDIVIRKTKLEWQTRMIQRLRELPGETRWSIDVTTGKFVICKCKTKK